MNRLLNITGACDFTIGGIGVGGGDVTGGAEDFAHVLGEVKAVCVPCTVLLDGQWASGYGLGRVPRDEPHGVERGARQVDGCDLEVVAVEEAQMAGGAAVAFHTFEHAAPHIVVVIKTDGVHTVPLHGIFGIRKNDYIVPQGGNRKWKALRRAAGYRGNK